MVNSIVLSKLRSILVPISISDQLNPMAFLLLDTANKSFTGCIPNVRSVD